MSAHIARIAAKVLASKGRAPTMMVTPEGKDWHLQWSELRALAKRYLLNDEEEFIPKSSQARKAMRGKLGSQ